MKREHTVDYNLKATWHAISRMYNHYGQPFDITASTGFVLINIDKNEGTPATKIAPLVGLEPRSLTRLLKSLEDKGLIYKVQDPHDRRSYRIFLTEKGKLKRAVSKMAVKIFNQKVLKKVGAKDYQVFLKVIECIHMILDDHDLFDEIEQQVNDLIDRSSSISNNFK